MKIKCLIVDDEPISREIIRRYLDEFDDFEIIAEAKNAAETIQFVNTHPIEVLFLDINMPKLSGLNMIKNLNPLPYIVFITAYPQYAVEGFEVHALDYLVKPVSPERFSQAITKVKKKIMTDRADSFLLIKSDRRTYKVSLNEIIYFKSSGDYLHVIREDKSLITKESIKNVLLSLPEDRFVQIHRSYIININYVKYMESNCISIDNVVLPIGDKYKQQLRQIIK